MKRAVRSKRTSERCGRTSKRTSEWPSTSLYSWLFSTIVQRSSPFTSYEYAKTILTLMTKEKHPDGKVLIIGGGIANFTNVAATFKGIVSALQRFKEKLQEHKIQIFIRRGGPNYQARKGGRERRRGNLGTHLPDWFCMRVFCRRFCFI